jgi:hypothetical protein
MQYEVMTDAPQQHPFGAGLPIRELCDHCASFLGAAELLALRAASKRHLRWVTEEMPEAWETLLVAELREGWTTLRREWRLRAPVQDVGALFLFDAENAAMWDEGEDDPDSLAACYMRECMRRLAGATTPRPPALERRTDVPSACAQALMDITLSRGFRAYWTLASIVPRDDPSPPAHRSRAVRQPSAAPFAVTLDAMPAERFSIAGDASAIGTAFGGGERVFYVDPRYVRRNPSRLASAPPAMRSWDSLEPNSRECIDLDCAMLLVSAEGECSALSPVSTGRPMMRTLPPWVDADTHDRLEDALQAGWLANAAPWRNDMIEEYGWIMANLGDHHFGHPTGSWPEERWMPLLLVNSIRVRRMLIPPDEEQHDDEKHQHQEGHGSRPFLAQPLLIPFATATHDLSSVRAFALAPEAGPSMAYIGEQHMWVMRET